MRRRLSGIVALALLPGLAGAVTLYTTDFESPLYTLGDLSGQNGWMVTPSNAVGSVQNKTYLSGSQAVELIDGASFGRAQQSIAGVPSPILSASYAMYFDDAWQGPMESDRFEAQMRVEVTGAPGTYGLEFGFVKAPNGGYESVPADGSAFFIEFATESASLAHAYDVVDYATYANGWHTYNLILDTQNDLVQLYVDGGLRTQLTYADDPTGISNIQLQNQRWGTNPSNSASLFFDDVNVSAVPEPGTLGALALGLAALFRRRAPKA
jgi:hypothetical protein